ncbi:MAG: methyltransferase domain-containing protein [Oscillospiraceae bacterium]|jgi:SAM-dependent methyltransferase|nr:methyltransferase domain-containing protein [Oscillospiraceae bacterium]
MMYQSFARVYDALMADVDYPRWAEYYLTLAQRAGVHCLRAADCACGTGNLTLALSRLGLSMTGLDLSVEMLRCAGEKARHLGIPVPFVRQDIRNLLLHRPMDALFCACDGVNYLTRPEDVQAFFAAAYRALRPGGGLFFDVSSPYKLETLLGNNCLGDDNPAASYIWQNHFDPAVRLLQMDLTFFVREADGRYSRFEETHWQRAHTAAELTEWLKAAGFESIALYGDRTFTPPDARTARLHLAAVRPA